MGYYAIGALAIVAGALGIAYVVLDPSDPQEDVTDRPTVAAVPDEPKADSAPKPVLKGPAARRMDDFGAGPGGITVTVPLRNRYEQAYSGNSVAGGGPKTTSGAGASSVDDPQEARVKNEPRVETAGLPADAADEETVEQPAYRVIERPVEDNHVPSGTETEAGQDAALDQQPSFDVIRVDPDGRTVIAGRAAPLTDVEIKVGDDVIDRVTSSATGEWVSIPNDPLTSGDQELSLTAIPKEGAPINSRQIVVVSVPETIDESQPEQPVAVVVDKEEGGAGRILQAPDTLQSPGDERLALKLVDYDDQGAIRLSGEAPPGVPVRIYIDNEPAALVIGNSKGYWITTLDQSLPGGDYTLRLDQLDGKGQTVARLETPLTRVATPPAEGEAKVDYVVVQPGNSLWRIARRLSGDGFNYVYIFEANEAQIRNPDVIYPGQVFEVPTDVSAEIAG